MCRSPSQIGSAPLRHNRKPGWIPSLILHPVSGVQGFHAFRRSPGRETRLGLEVSGPINRPPGQEERKAHHLWEKRFLESKETSLKLGDSLFQNANMLRIFYFFLSLGKSSKTEEGDSTTFSIFSSRSFFSTSSFFPHAPSILNTSSSISHGFVR